MYLLETAPQPSFMFWFLTEVFFVAVVAGAIYFFIIKNPKINKPNKPRNYEEKDKPIS